MNIRMMSHVISVVLLCGLLPVTAYGELDVSVVVSRSPTDDISWIKSLNPSVSVAMYTLPGDNITVEHPDLKGHAAKIYRRFKMNECADEHGKYLVYIVEHYDAFPDAVVFLHGHAQSWHESNDKASAVQQLIDRITKDSTSHRQGIKYLPPKNCASWQVDLSMVNASLWSKYFQKELGNKPPNYPQPHYYLTPCCSQFAASREAVKQHPLEFYISLLELACTSTATHDDITKILERSYSLIFRLDGRLSGWCSG